MPTWSHKCPLLLCRTFLANREASVDFLNTVDRIYVVDGYANWDPNVSFLFLCSTAGRLTTQGLVLAAHCAAQQHTRQHTGCSAPQPRAAPGAAARSSAQGLMAQDRSAAHVLSVRLSCILAPACAIAVHLRSTTKAW